MEYGAAAKPLGHGIDQLIETCLSAIKQLDQCIMMARTHADKLIGYEPPQPTIEKGKGESGGDFPVRDPLSHRLVELCQRITELERQLGRL